MTRTVRIVTSLLLLTGVLGTAKLFLVQDPFIDTPRAWLQSFLVATMVACTAGYALLVDRRVRPLAQPQHSARGLSDWIQGLHTGQIVIVLLILAGLFYGTMHVRQ
ncbi:MAG: hypothetical protein ABJC19_11450, partial [Gemmatimonadota bacterium]